MTSTIGDVIRSAKALGTGALISKAAARERLAPITASMQPFAPLNGRIYYGLGLVVDDQWLVPRPGVPGEPWTYGSWKSCGKRSSPKFASFEFSKSPAWKHGA